MRLMPRQAALGVCALLAVAGCASALPPNSLPTVPATPVGQRPRISGPVLTPAASQSSPTPSEPAGTVPPSPLSPGASPTPTISTAGACGDDAYTLNGYTWTGPFDWYFNGASTPDEYDVDAVVEVLKRSVENITTAANDCGLPDNVDLTANYNGLTVEGACKDESSNRNIFGFAKIGRRFSRDTIGYLCPYTYADGDLARAHIVISTEIGWALSADSCSGNEEVLEATVTHEFGHAVGLGHVSERRHGDLTMSTRSNGFCTSEEISLGLGDILGLEELY